MPDLDSGHYLTDELIETLAQSISYHSAKKHLSDFNVSTREELVDKIKAMLKDPETEFMIRKAVPPQTHDSVFFINKENYSFLAFNPNQIEGGDNFAGTFMREPKLNADGVPAKSNGNPLNNNNIQKRFNGTRNGQISQVARSRGIDKSEVRIQKIDESDEWAKIINKYENDIKEGLEKGVKKLQEPEVKPSILPDNDITPGSLDAKNEIVLEDNQVTNTSIDSASNKSVNSLEASKSADVISEGANIGERLHAYMKQLGIAKIADQIGDLRKIKTAEDAAQFIKGLKVFTNGLKLTKLSVITSVGVPAVASGLMKWGQYAQKELAQEFLQQGKITEDAYYDYIKSRDDFSIFEQTENWAALGPTFLITTPALEWYGADSFKDISHEHNFSQEVHEALNPTMGLLYANSMSAEFAIKLGKIANTDMKNLPNELNSFWEAKQNLDHANRIGAFDPTSEQRQMIAEAKQAYLGEVALALNNPKRAQMLLSRFPKEDLIEMVASTAQHNARGQPEIIQEIGQAQKTLDELNEELDCDGMDPDYESALEVQRNELAGKVDQLRQKLSDGYDKDPTLVNAYISDVFGGELPDDMTPAADLTNQGVEYARQFENLTESAQNHLLNEIVRSADTSHFDLNTSTYIRDLIALHQLTTRGNFDFDSEYDKHNRRVKLDELYNKYGSRIDFVENYSIYKDKYKAHIIEKIRDNPEVVGRFLADSPKGAELMHDAQEVLGKEEYLAELRAEYVAAKEAFGAYGENPTDGTKAEASSTLEALQQRFDNAPDSINWSSDFFSYNGDDYVGMRTIMEELEEGREALNKEPAQQSPEAYAQALKAAYEHGKDIFGQLDQDGSDANKDMALRALNDLEVMLSEQPEGADTRFSYNGQTVTIDQIKQEINEGYDHVLNKGQDNDAGYDEAKATQFFVAAQNKDLELSITQTANSSFESAPSKDFEALINEIDLEKTSTPEDLKV